MATPKVVTDASSDLDEAVLNLFLNALVAQAKCNFFALKFEAAGDAVTVHARSENGEVVDGDLAWNAGSVRIDITLTGFTEIPVIFASILDNSSTNVAALEMGESASTTLQTISFRAAGVAPAAVDPDGDVYLNVFIIGK